MARVLFSCVLSLFATLAAVDARALAQLEARTAICFGSLIPVSNCEFSPPEFGPGAEASQSKVDTGSEGQIGRSASVTVHDWDHFSAHAQAGIDFTLEATGSGGLFRNPRGAAFARVRDQIVASGATGNGLIRMQWQIEGLNTIVQDSINPLVITSVTGEVMLVAICNSGPGLLNDCTPDTLRWKTADPSRRR